MKQTLLKLTLPAGAELRPGHLRTLAAALDKPSPALFSRDEHGATVVYPGVRFVGGRGWVGAVADEHHEDVLMRHTGQIIMAVSKHFELPCAVEVETHHCGLEPLQHPKEYRALRVAIKKRHAAARTADIAELLAERIYQSIDRTCARFGLDCPDKETLGVVGVHVEREIGMRLDTDQGATQEFVSLIDATFSVHADLKGLWFVGNLTARGYGRVIKPFGTKGGQ